GGPLPANRQAGRSTSVSTDPDIAPHVLCYRAHSVMRKSVTGRVVLKSIAVEAAEPVRGANPHASLRFLIDRVNVALAQAGRSAIMPRRKMFGRGTRHDVH